MLCYLLLAMSAFAAAYGPLFCVSKECECDAVSLSQCIRFLCTQVTFPTPIVDVRWAGERQEFDKVA
jgi:hypothetical protein